MNESRRAALKKLGLLSLAGLSAQVVTLTDASLNPAAAKKKKAKKKAKKKNPGAKKSAAGKAKATDRSGGKAFSGKK